MGRSTRSQLWRLFCVFFLSSVEATFLRNDQTAPVDIRVSASTSRREVESSAEEVICRFIIGRQVSLDADGYHERERKDYRCQTFASEGIPRLMYDLPGSVLSQLNIHELKSGKSILRIHHAKAVRDPVNGFFLDVGANVSVEVLENLDRRLQSRSQGTSTVLAVLVKSSDSVNSFGPDSAAENIFSPDITSFASQYDKCSAGKLKFIPATDPRISNGVAEIFIDLPVLGREMSTTIENTLQSSLMDTFGSVDVADHILYCMPAGMVEGWIGYTYGDDIASYINDQWCNFYTLPMHEVGHQLGLQHSNELGQEYEDKSCVMGKSYFQIGGPKMCFNALKFYQLNWFPEHTLEIFPQRDGPWTGNIAAFVDVRKLQAGTIPIIVKVGNAYLLYNFRKDYNVDVSEKPNHVTIALGEPLPCDTCTSDMIGAVHETEVPLVTADINVGESMRITFEACGASQQNGIDMKLVSIRLEGESSSCPPPGAGPQIPGPVPFIVPPTGSPTDEPTSTPVPPTSAPVQPTLAPVSPTQEPTPRPTIEPTPSPIAPTPTPVVPTLKPTDRPTAAPVTPTMAPVSPTESPTQSPTSTPTAAPLAPTPPPVPPTLAPVVPTMDPTQRPTFKPSLAPVPLTLSPTDEPTTAPMSPTPAPNPPTFTPVVPTREPTQYPSLRPSISPVPPTLMPTPVPLTPTLSPVVPTGIPTPRPTQAPVQSTKYPEAILQTGTVRIPPVSASAALSNVKTSAPLLPITVCDDSDNATFVVASLNETHECVWLRDRPEYIGEVCSTPAGFTSCLETCGFCSDDCFDTDSKFFVGTEIRECVWLQLRPSRKQEFCVESSNFTKFCPETCGGCDVKISLIEAAVSITSDVESSQASLCDDNATAKFFVPDITQFRGCAWLAARPERHPSLCRPGDESNAYNICAETCGKCSDSCEDSTSTFLIANETRDCSWLSRRPEIRDKHCVSGYDAFSLCLETCNRCDSFAPTAVPSKNPSPAPSEHPSVAPSVGPSAAPTFEPSANPTSSLIPSIKPSERPSTHPSSSMTPTVHPSQRPSAHPSQGPSIGPSPSPTNDPTSAPSPSPTIDPTSAPSPSPTTDPTAVPTSSPSYDPSKSPSSRPSETRNPSVDPSRHPSRHPSFSPSRHPSFSPSSGPSVSRDPSLHPSRRASTDPSQKPSNDNSLAPTTNPTVIQSSIPSAPPSLLPPRLVCDDNMVESFYVPERSEFKKCDWLVDRPKDKETLCQEGSGSTARDVCPETCGVCIDDCVDSAGDFIVDFRRRDCEWLSRRPERQGTLCLDARIASTCKETCNLCDAGINSSSSEPSSAPGNSLMSWSDLLNYFGLKGKG